MGKTDNTVLKELIAGMAVYGIVLQIAVLVIPGDRMRMSAGVWLGIVTGMLMAVHMKNSLDEALDRSESEAQKYLHKTYAVRYLTVVVVFVAASWLGVVNVLTLFMGVMGLKIAAYLQPLMHKIFLRRNKK